MPSNATSDPAARRARPFWTLAAALWIFGTTILFYTRFTWAFYTANRSAIDGAIDAVLRAAGMGE